MPKLTKKKQMAQIYKINGWINLINKSPIIQNYYDEQVDLDAIVTDSNKLTIYLTSGRCSTKEEKEYHKTYKSTDGFTHFEVLRLIQKTYWLACKDIWDGDKDMFSNLALHTFNYYPDTNEVYPDTDS